MRRTPRAITALGVALVVAATALAGAPAPKADFPAAPSAKAPSLATYIPKDKLIYYAEFQGTDAHADAWSKAAASKILNDTPTGAMLEDLLTQLLNVPFRKAPVAEQKPTPAEVVAVFKHAGGAGTIFAVHAKAGARQGVVKTMVYPGAMRDDASKKTFAAFVQGLTPPGGKTAAVAKPGNRTIIVVTRPDGTVHLNFWVENKLDLVVTDDPDAVIAALDKTAPNATDHPTRVALLKGEAGEDTIGLGWLENSSVPGESPLREPFGSKVDTSSIQRVTYRLALREADLVHDLRVVAPSPRPAALALFDGAKFDMKTMPTLPDGVVEFSALAIDPAKLYGQVAALAKATNPRSEAAFAKLEASAKAKTKLRLREDVLGRLGPRILAYTSPTKSAEKPTGLMSILGGGGFQVPKGAILIEMKDAKAASTMLDALVIAANKEIRAAMTPPADDADKAGPGRSGGRANATAKAQATPEFRPGATNPKTYNLSLPPAIGAMTNLRLSIVVGKKYLIVATMPDAAKEALAAESKTTGGVLSGDVAKVVEGLPPGLVLLEVADPSDTLPEGLAHLPATLTSAFAPPPPVAAPPPPPPRDRPAGGGRVGAGRPTAAAPGVALPTSGTAGEGGNPAPPGGAAPAAPPPAGPTFQVDPAKTPSADAIRPLLGPSAAAVFADDQGIRLMVRHRFPDLGLLASLPATIRGLGGSARALGSGKAPGMAAPRGTAPPPGGQGGRPPGVMPID